MLLEETQDWTTIDAYARRPPSRRQLLAARVGWLWLMWRAAAMVRRRERQIERLRDAARMLPDYVRRDIGLM